ncbi:NUDIX hydrolase [Schauerella aestuarii]|uniref:NUDIX hydrolase n=1 Tax=Schauerella aestuarii TaxID=2511204 RepID=UPI001370D7AA|nr:NUDIX hydrolase [Achromobacter aestuarii]MYZ42961.1 NUDIX hydrolase [Achromobacter aestuarii]
MSDDPAFYFPAPRRAHFCSQCGTPITRRVPPDDNRERDVCEHCGAIHYQNPRIVVGTLPVLGDRVLLCRRAIEPRYDTWTLPAGFMELAETISEGAMRETAEEAGASIELGTLYTVIDVARVDQVHVYFLAHARDDSLNPGPESLEARFFTEAEIPWDNLSFGSVVTTLRHFFADRKAGTFPTHHYAID